MTTTNKDKEEFFKKFTDKDEYNSEGGITQYTIWGGYPHEVWQWIEEKQKQELYNFAEFCHEHYKGTAQVIDGWEYSYDDQVVGLVDKFLLQNQTSDE